MELYSQIRGRSIWMKSANYFKWIPQSLTFTRQKVNARIENTSGGTFSTGGPAGSEYQRLPETNWILSENAADKSPL